MNFNIKFYFKVNFKPIRGFEIWVLHSAGWCPIKSAGHRESWVTSSWSWCFRYFRDWVRTIDSSYSRGCEFIVGDYGDLVSGGMEWDVPEWGLGGVGEVRGWGKEGEVKRGGWGVVEEQVRRGSERNQDGWGRPGPVPEGAQHDRRQEEDNPWTGLWSYEFLIDLGINREQIFVMPSHLQ